MPPPRARARRDPAPVMLTPSAASIVGAMSIVIVGAGPNLGLAIGRRFGSEGMPVGLVSRDQAKLDGLVEQLEEDGIRASSEASDIREPDALSQAIQALAARPGPGRVTQHP